MAVHSVYSYNKSGVYVYIEQNSVSYHYDERAKIGSYICNVWTVHNNALLMNRKRLYTDGKDFYLRPTDVSPLFSYSYAR